MPNQQQQRCYSMAVALCLSIAFAMAGACKKAASATEQKPVPNFATETALTPLVTTAKPALPPSALPSKLPVESTKPPLDPVAEALPDIVRQIQALDLPAAYVALADLEERHPGQPDVQRLRADLRVVLAGITPGQADTKTLLAGSVRIVKRLGDLPAFDQTQFLLFVKQAQAKRDLSSLLRDVKAFCVRQPDFPGGWLLQGRLALALQRPIEGGYATQNLVRLGAIHSTDQGIIATMAALETAGMGAESLVKSRP